MDFMAMKKGVSSTEPNEGGKLSSVRRLAVSKHPNPARMEREEKKKEKKNTRAAITSMFVPFQVSRAIVWDELRWRVLRSSRIF